MCECVNNSREREWRAKILSSQKNPGNSTLLLCSQNAPQGIVCAFNLQVAVGLGVCWADVVVRLPTNKQKMCWRSSFIRTRDHNCSSTPDPMSNRTFNETLNVQCWAECNFNDVHDPELSAFRQWPQLRTLCYFLEGGEKCCAVRFILYSLHKCRLGTSWK